jgi:prevent-host-death family protein
MKKASIASVKARFSEYLRGLEKGPLVVTRNGRPVGVLLGVQDEDEIEQLILGYTPRLRPLLEAAEQRIYEGKSSQDEGCQGEMEAERSDKTKPDRARPKRRGSRKA